MAGNLLQSYFKEIQDIPRENKSLACVRSCELLAEAVRDRIVSFEVFDFIQKIVDYVNSLDQINSNMSILLPKLNYLKSDALDNLEENSKYLKIKLELHNIALDAQKDMLETIYKTLEEKKTVLNDPRYLILKPTIRLFKKFQVTKTIHENYLEMHSLNLNQLRDQIKAYSIDSENDIIEAARFNDKVINLNEEIIQRVEKFLEKQKNLPIEFYKTLEARKVQIEIQEEQLETDTEEFKNDLQNFAEEEKSLLEKNLRTKLIFGWSFKDSITYALLYTLIGISIGFVFPLIFSNSANKPVYS